MDYDYAEKVACLAARTAEIVQSADNLVTFIESEMDRVARIASASPYQHVRKSGIFSIGSCLTTFNVYVRPTIGFVTNKIRDPVRMCCTLATVVCGDPNKSNFEKDAFLMCANKVFDTEVERIVETQQQVTESVGIVLTQFESFSQS